MDTTDTLGAARTTRATGARRTIDATDRPDTLLAAGSDSLAVPTATHPVGPGPVRPDLSRHDLLRRDFAPPDVLGLSPLTACAAVWLCGLVAACSLPPDGFGGGEAPSVFDGDALGWDARVDPVDAHNEPVADAAQDSGAAVDAANLDVPGGGVPADTTGTPDGGEITDVPCAQPPCGDSQCADQPEGAPCDDGEACTSADTCRNGWCEGGENTCQCATPLDCAPYQGGDLCKGTLVCDVAVVPHVCVVDPATVVVCAPPAGDSCLIATCDAALGTCVSQAAPAGASCDDGNPCLVSQCTDGGVCMATAETCQCQGQEDCTSLEDGDVCNGTLYCDKSSMPYSCAVNPATVVNCPAVAAGPCLQDTCEAGTGACLVVLVDDGLACDDADPCTAGDQCSAGTCSPGPAGCPCAADADCVQWEDGDVCNGTLFCNLALAQCAVNPATAVTCPTAVGGSCFSSTCVAATGACELLQLADQSPCSDGDACTLSDVCLDGACVVTGLAAACTCVGDADCAALDDGDPCTGTLYCDLVDNSCKPNPVTVVQCPSVDDTDCRESLCQPDSGLCELTALAEGAACQDGSLCTSGDACAAGACVSGALMVCPCVDNADCVAVDDDDLCNGPMYCNKALPQPHCEFNPAGAVTCNVVDDTACAENICQPTTGACDLTPRPEGTSCDDDNFCTVDDGCAGGVCVPGPTQCPCEDDGDCAAFDDGDLCNGLLFCAKGWLPWGCAPNPGSVVACSPAGDDICAKASCDPKSGACGPTAINDGAGCDDGDACTKGDVCLAALCLGAQPLQCDDGNACTDDSCLPASGCQNGLNATPCDDGEVCTQSDVCAAGACKAGAQQACDDANPCTTDTCVSGEGCANGAVVDGAPCAGGTCQAGACVPPAQAKSVCGGVQHACALKVDGTVSCWGTNGYGQVGAGVAEPGKNYYTPQAVVGLSGVAAIACGTMHTCAIGEDGSVSCWGSSTHGQLGDGAQGPFHTLGKATLVPALAGAVQVVGGSLHTCLRKPDGTVACVGDGQYGQLGTGNKSGSLVPVAVKGLTGAQALAAGGTHTCAIVAGGKVVCWGHNETGQIGDGTKIDRPSPTAVVGLSGVVQLSAVYRHTCALKTGGSVACWGKNTYNQSGKWGTSADQTTPVIVAGVGGIAAIGLGGHHSCAIQMGGAVLCWGYNEDAALGNGTKVYQAAPVAVQGLKDAVVVGNGWLHSCAIHATGSLSCWGDGGYGQIGSGYVPVQMTPKTVKGF